MASLTTTESLYMEIQPITWHATLPIRHQVLWPNKPMEFCHVENDESAWHFGVFLEQKLVSVASLYPDDTQIRLRKFATLAEYQGQGIGSQLLRHTLEVAKQQQMESYWCDARESAIGFYQRFGLSTEGERFFKSDVAYFKMRKTLL